MRYFGGRLAPVIGFTTIGDPMIGPVTIGQWIGHVIGVLIDGGSASILLTVSPLHLEAGPPVKP
jgi:hypothetical protein